MIASEMASRHQPMNWLDSIGFQTLVTQEAFPKRESSRIIELPMIENLLSTAPIKMNRQHEENSE